jgi:DnaJ-class molecular chaperone
MGAKSKNQTVRLEVQIPKGAPKGHYINYPEQGNQHPDYLTGDLVLKLIPKPHPVYKKKKSDLYIQQKVSLFEALTGFKFNVEKLDGTVVTIKTEPNEVIKHKQLKKVSGLGLPVFERNYTFGDLYIEFIVEYPDRIEDEEREKLREVLGEGIIQFKETDKSYQMKTIKQPEMEIIDEEEEQQQHFGDDSQNVQCQSQ